MSAVAACVAEIFSLQFDTAKVRLQLQKIEPGCPPKYTSVLQTIARMSMEEGPRALFYGLVPGLYR